MLEAYELAADAFTSTAAERSAEPESFWVNRIADPSGTSVVFGAFDDQDLVGTVALEFTAKPKTKHKAHVIGMYVKPTARSSGAGRSLLMATINHAKSIPQLLQLTLTVTAGNAPAIGLYRSLGFQEYGTEPLAILTPSGYKGKVLMWLPIQHAPTAA